MVPSSEDHPESSPYLGKHTTLSYIIDQNRIWRRIPYLKDNYGRAPPIVLAVGDRRRVYSIARRLRNAVFLPESAAVLSRKGYSKKGLPGVAEFGRVAMAIGMASRSVPILVVETQMGAPATQIIMKEILSDQLMSTEYRVGKIKIDMSQKVVIRVGTAGGINCEGMPEIKVGDVVNATHSIGATGAVIQSLAGLDFWHASAIEQFHEKWRSLGALFTFTEDGHPRAECSDDVVDALGNAGKQLAAGTYHQGGNITKDSLYVELSLEPFLGLCRKQNCRSTEMELSAIAVSAQQSKARFGMISAIVGVLPGSFSESERDKSVAEQRALRVALEAVKRLVLRS